LRITSAEDARSVVRKYIVGTRSRHGKIISILVDEDTKGPDDKGVWSVMGVYSTEVGGKEPFTATVTPRGEVMITTQPSDTSEKRRSKPGR
jgi:hypothetical protein